MGKFHIYLEHKISIYDHIINMFNYPLKNAYLKLLDVK